MDLHYYDTLIAVAADCPVSQGTVPSERAGKPTIAVLQYRMLADEPFVYTQPEVLFNVWLERQAPSGLTDSEVARLRDEFFARSQACLRASPLPKQYGWGLLFDREGKIALLAVDSPEYRELVSGQRVRVVPAMRSRRA